MAGKVEVGCLVAGTLGLQVQGSEFIARIWEGDEVLKLKTFWCLWQVTLFLKKKQKDKRKKHTTYALEHPEPKSKEFDSPTYNIKALADIKVLNIEAFEISAMDAIVLHIKTDRKFWGKNRELILQM